MPKKTRIAIYTYLFKGSCSPGPVRGVFLRPRRLSCGSTQSPLRDMTWLPHV
jgi:hypothetical protein